MCKLLSVLLFFFQLIDINDPQLELWTGKVCWQSLGAGSSEDEARLLKETRYPSKVMSVTRASTEKPGG